MKIYVDDKLAVREAVEVLRSGGLVMHPTETCYGLAVDVFSLSALRKLYEVKGMPLDKPISILVDGIDMAKKYGEFSDVAEKLARKYWPGPLSIVVPRKSDLPEFCNPSNDFVSIRHSSSEFCLNLISLMGTPVSTTSANKFGEPEFYSPTPLDGVDLLVDGGLIEGTKPSTIVKVEGGKLQVLRQGSVEV
jgi:L-threonylcarbamoyladenylate synthase